MPQPELTDLELKISGQAGFSEVRAETLKDRPFIHRRFLEMAKKAGLENPHLYVGKNEYPTACQLPFYNDIIVSEKLLDLLNDREVVAVIAHEMGHAMHDKKHHATRYVSFGVGSAVGIGVYKGVRHLADRLLPSESPPRRMSRRGFIKAAAAGVLAAKGCGETVTAVDPTVSAWMRQLRENEADDEGVRLSGDQEAFVSALAKLEKYYPNELSREFDKRISRMESPPRER